VTDERTHARITSDPLCEAELVAFVTVPEAGGLVTFSGNVRNHHEGRAVERIEYEVAGPLAAAKLRELVAETVERFDVHRAAAEHRTGVVEVGEASVIVSVSASHRDEAFLAARHLIDRIKQALPVWKKERFADGTDEWVSGVPVPEGDRC
jgi:molybdopterin synthase catalytic subunit